MRGRPVLTPGHPEMASYLSEQRLRAVLGAWAAAHAGPPIGFLGGGRKPRKRYERGAVRSRGRLPEEEHSSA